MAECARKVIRENGLEERIRIIPKRSTSMTVGAGGDMEHRANVLVTEVFDTELIGEGAIATFSHAHAELLEVMTFGVDSFEDRFNVSRL
jgi:protein arginine N-methyltransferase 7